MGEDEAQDAPHAAKIEWRREYLSARTPDANAPRRAPSSKTAAATKINGGYAEVVWDFTEGAFLQRSDGPPVNKVLHYQDVGNLLSMNTEKVIGRDAVVPRPGRIQSSDRLLRRIQHTAGHSSCARDLPGRVARSCTSRSSLRER